MEYNSLFSFICLGTVPLELKMEGEDILSVQEIKRRSKTLSSDYMHIKTVKEGSIIICLDVESSAFTSLGFFLELIETLLSTVLQRNHDSNNDSTSCVIISLDFMDTNNGEFWFVYMERLRVVKYRNFVENGGMSSLSRFYIYCLSMFCFVSVSTLKLVLYFHFFFLENL